MSGGNSRSNGNSPTRVIPSACIRSSRDPNEREVEKEPKLGEVAGADLLTNDNTPNQEEEDRRKENERYTLVVLETGVKNCFVN